MLDSTSYSDDRCGKYKNVSLLTNSSSNTNATFDGYNKDYDVVNSRELGYGQVEDPTSEGVWVPHLRSPRQFSRTRKRWAIISLTRPVAPKDSILLAARHSQTSYWGMNVTGYNRSNSCKLVNEYSNSMDIDPSKFTNVILLYIVVAVCIASLVQPAM
jgi:hypothetical protein